MKLGKATELGSSFANFLANFLLLLNLTPLPNSGMLTETIMCGNVRRYSCVRSSVVLSVSSPYKIPMLDFDISRVEITQSREYG
jgi:hypothetical protein